MQLLEQTSGMPLVLAKVGDCVTLVSIRADQNVKSRLTAMGLCPGVQISLAGRSHHGPCILIVKGVRLALDWGTAHRILVR
jgi:Fe2+ transport system protein FeoA